MSAVPGAERPHQARQSLATYLKIWRASLRLRHLSVKTDCLPPQQKRRYVALSMYHSVFLRARERNESDTYKRGMSGRKTVAEGVFASLDRRGWEECKLRVLWKVDCEGYMAAFAHNFKKAVRKLGASGPLGYRHEGALAAA